MKKFIIGFAIVVTGLAVSSCSAGYSGSTPRSYAPYGPYGYSNSYYYPQGYGNYYYPYGYGSPAYNYGTSSNRSYKNHDADDHHRGEGHHDRR
ncbi:MAG: hypothetical protein ACJ75J_00370 [Cytophagaceae bacterium]